MKTWVLAGMCVATLACSQETANAPAVLSAAGMPSIEEIVVQVDAEDLPFHEPTSIALTRGGYLSYPVGPAAAGRFVSVDSSGRLTARWGRGGEGPGEQWAGTIVSGDSVLAVVATHPPALQVFSPHGELISELRQVPVDGFPQPLIGDSIDRSFGQRLVGSVSVLEDVKGPIVRSCIYRTCSRTLLAADDSFLRVVHLSTPRKGGLRWPPYAADSGQFVLGDGVGYRLWSFHEDGSFLQSFGRELPRRTLSPREVEAERQRLAKRVAGGTPIDIEAALEQVQREPLPHFGYAGLAFDGMHRLWVRGTTGDSTFLDVFQNGRFLGRHVLDCLSTRAAFAVRGRWLAVVCADEDDEVAPYRVRLFRIREPSPTT